MIGGVTNRAVGVDDKDFLIRDEVQEVGIRCGLLDFRTGNDSAKSHVIESRIPVVSFCSGPQFIVSLFNGGIQRKSLCRIMRSILHPC